MLVILRRRVIMIPPLGGGLVDLAQVAHNLHGGEIRGIARGNRLGIQSDEVETKLETGNRNILSNMVVGWLGRGSM